MSSSTLLKMPGSIADPAHPPIEDLIPNVELIESDGEPLESDWHVKQFVTLVDSINHHFRERDDFYTAGNMFVYFSEEQARNRDFRGPDFFFVKNTNHRPMRPYWCVWKEGGRTPNVVIELCSPSTIDIDRGEKKEIYEQRLHVNEYYCYDPFSRRLEGWRLDPLRYKPLKLDKVGRLWSRELGLWIGPWDGPIMRYEDRWIRFFTEEGELVLLPDEAERARADRAEAEVAELRALLAGKTNGHANGGAGHRKKKK